MIRLATANSGGSASFSAKLAVSHPARCEPRATLGALRYEVNPIRSPFGFSGTAQARPRGTSGQLVAARLNSWP
jgi:hypothetical protein